MGPPGSGKGTQATLLAEEFSLYHLETSKILEEKFKENNLKEKFIFTEGQKYSSEKEKKLWKTGNLCSPPFVAYLTEEKIKELFKDKKSLILSGSPRTIYEGEKIIPLLKRLYGLINIQVIFLEITPQETIFRNSHRRICQLMRHPILFSKENEKLKKCPLDGSKLIKRMGLDAPETIKVRLKEYKERTYPIIELFKKQGLKVRKINGLLSPANVFRNILKIIKVD